MNEKRFRLNLRQDLHGREDCLKRCLTACNSIRQWDRTDFKLVCWFAGLLRGDVVTLQADFTAKTRDRQRVPWWISRVRPEGERSCSGAVVCKNSWKESQFGNPLRDVSEPVHAYRHISYHTSFSLLPPKNMLRCVGVGSKRWLQVVEAIKEWILRCWLIKPCLFLKNPHDSLSPRRVSPPIFVSNWKKCCSIFAGIPFCDDTWTGWCAFIHLLTDPTDCLPGRRGRFLISKVLKKELPVCAEYFHRSRAW